MGRSTREGARLDNRGVRSIPAEGRQGALDECISLNLPTGKVIGRFKNALEILKFVDRVISDRRGRAM